MRVGPRITTKKDNAMNEMIEKLFALSETIKSISDGKLTLLLRRHGNRKSVKS